MRNRATKANPHMGVRFFYALLLLLSLPAAASELDSIVQWHKSGAFELALSELDSKQPAPEQKLDEWLRWERQRYALYQSLGRWKGILERQQSLPAAVDAKFRLWAEVQAVHALLAMNDVDAALQWVTRQIWSNLYPDGLQIWRALLVQVYAAQQDDAAATIAWRRYRQDELQNQAAGDAAATSLSQQEYAAAKRAYARTLIRQEQYQEAARELTDDSSVDGRLLFASSQLLIAGDTAEQVYSISQQIAESDSASPAQRRQAYGLMSRAAARQKQYRQRVQAIVKALSIPVAASQSNALLTVNADELWAAYEAWGLSVGLAAGLNIDYETQWLAGLKITRAADETVALASVLVLSGRGARNREQAADYLLAALPQLANGAEQTLWLLNDSERLQQSYVDMPANLQRASLRAALRIADTDTVKAFRERHGPVVDPIADQANGILDVHARLLLGKSAPANKFLTEGLDNLSAWFQSSQQDLLVLLRDLYAAGYYAPVAMAGEKLAKQSSDRRMRISGAEFACQAMIKTGQYVKAAKLALSLLSDSADAESNDLALLAYEAMWQGGMRADAEQLWHRHLTAPEVQGRAADLRRRLLLPASR